MENLKFSKFNNITPIYTNEELLLLKIRVQPLLSLLTEIEKNDGCLFSKAAVVLFCTKNFYRGPIENSSMHLSSAHSSTPQNADDFPYYSP